MYDLIQRYFVKNTFVLYKVDIKDRMIILSHTAWQNININHKIFCTSSSPLMYFVLFICVQIVSPMQFGHSQPSQRIILVQTH